MLCLLNTMWHYHSLANNIKILCMNRLQLRPLQSPAVGSKWCRFTKWNGAVLMPAVDCPCNWSKQCHSSKWNDIVLNPEVPPLRLLFIFASGCFQFYFAGASQGKEARLIRRFPSSLRASSSSSLSVSLHLVERRRFGLTAGAWL